jgi:predicted NAD/FAD-binding protein
MKIAVVGSGIAGNVAAYRLARDHDVTVFEAAGRIGGHSHTVDVTHAGRDYALDTGFIVFNNRTYPRFAALLDELGVASQASDMSFSVRNDLSGLEYKGSNLNSLFAQRRNLLRPAFHGMLRDILRFNREAPRLLAADSAELTLGEFLERQRYSRAFIDDYIVPMGAAIWSAPPRAVRRMPAVFFVRFFDNHGMLTVNDRPQWRVVNGGSRRYVDRLVASFRDRIRLNARVDSIRRRAGHVEIRTPGALPERFDQVFIACHSDEALALLADASPLEREVLGAIPYQANEAVLHTDERLMPRRRRAWAAWNYHVAADSPERVAVTYNLNILQGIDAPVQFCVSLNHARSIDPSRIIRRIPYAHPLFTREAVIAQGRQAELNGRQRTYFCGAYWRFGFHEDGVVSALNALDHFCEREGYAQRNLRRAG